MNNHQDENVKTEENVLQAKENKEKKVNSSQESFFSQSKLWKMIKKEILFIFKLIIKRVFILIDVIGLCIIYIPFGCLIGSYCSIFLYSVIYVNKLRISYPWLLYLLPVSGIIQVILFKTEIGRNVGTGNNLILEKIYINNSHPINKKESTTSIKSINSNENNQTDESKQSKPDKSKFFYEIPIKMGPLQFFSTILTHICGGSTGIQVGGACASIYIKLLRFISCDRFPLSKHDLDNFHIVEIGSSLTGLFGTPFAGAIYGVELLRIGKLSTFKILPSLISSISAHFIARTILSQLNIQQIKFFINKDHIPSTYDYRILTYIIILSIFCGWVSFLFIFFIKKLREVYSIISLAFIRLIQKIVKRKFEKTDLAEGILTAIIGSCIIIAFRYLFNSVYYLGLGGNIQDPNDPYYINLKSFFTNPNCPKYSFLLKILFTVVTISAGFKGGEVITLFFIGAALGNFVGQIFDIGYSYYAALGLVGVLSSSTNAPIASVLFGLELFYGDGGTDFVVIFGLVGYLSYVLSGWTGIFPKQSVYSMKVFPFFNINNKKSKAEVKYKSSLVENEHEEIVLNIENVENVEKV